MHKFVVVKSETNSCLNPAPFQRKVTLSLFSFDSFPLSCSTFLPSLESITTFSIRGLTGNKKYQKTYLKALFHETLKSQRPT